MGLLFTTKGIYFRFADGKQGNFRWAEIRGAGNAADGLEVVLSTGARLRWGNQLAPFGDRVEAILDGLAKSDAIRGGARPLFGVV